jgi:hypothetical protein
MQQKVRAGSKLQWHLVWRIMTVHKGHTSVAVSLHMPPAPRAANNVTHLTPTFDPLVLQAYDADQKQQHAPAPEADQGPVGDAGSSDDSDDGFVAITKPLSGSTTPSVGPAAGGLCPFVSAGEAAGGFRSSVPQAFPAVSAAECLHNILACLL